MRNSTRTYFKIRVFMVLIFFLFSLGLIAARAYKLQVLDRHKSLAVAKHQYYAKRILLTPHRGTVYDTRGREMAVSIRVHSVYAQPLVVRNKKRVVAKLAPILGMDSRHLLELLSETRSFQWLQRKVTPDQHAKIKALCLRGIGFIPESRRFYPNREIGAHVLGFAGIDSQGLEGIEKVYDGHLKAADTVMLQERDALGRWIYVPAEDNIPKAPHNVFLTLDLRIQYVAERELAQGVKALRARGGMVVAMEPFTGRILAMSVQPSFNPNLFSRYGPDSWRNRVITDPFEPGSLSKVFLLAAALEEDVVKENDIFFCENGSYRMGATTIHDMKPHGWLSVRNIIKVSSNIGASKVGERLGAVRLHRYLRAFGFTERTDVDLVGETKGIIRPAGSWRGVDLASISFGQGISVTALQLISALSSMANGGNLMKPYVVERITDDKGRVVQEYFPVVKRRVLSKETCLRVTSILKSVVSREGTGSLAQVPGYAVAGKTGTAQKADLTKGGYSENKIIASFMGFIPADNPRVAIVVVLDEPTPSTYGGLGAAPIFRRIAQEVVQQMGVPTNGDNRGTTLQLAKTYIPERQRREAVQEPSPSRMPDLRGLSVRKALIQLQRERVSIRLSGTGRLIRQRPEPGMPLEDGEEVLLKFAPIQ